MTTNLLNLSGYLVTNVDETEHDYHITAEASNPPATAQAAVLID
jgi:hypothetical protein